MKLIILGGGEGTRLGPLTTSINKHLLPVGKEPMIGYSSRTGKEMGFKSALYITSAGALTPMAMALTANYPVPQPYFTIQNAPSGIAHAISMGKNFCEDGAVTVLLGDNVFQSVDVADFKLAKECFKGGCIVWTKTVSNPSDYGVLDREANRIIEKPNDPPSALAIVGIYMFDNTVWKKIEELSPSDRGEYEVTDLINLYLSKGECHIRHLKGEWNDLGRSVDQYLKISAEYGGLKVE